MRLIACLVVIFSTCACTVKPVNSVSEPEQDTCTNNEELMMQLAVQNESLFECAEYPFDMTGSPCDIAGWQSFVYSAMINIPPEVGGNTTVENFNQSEKIKQLIILSQPYQPLDSRIKATEQLLDESYEYLNAFGDFLYVLANHYAQINKLELENSNLASEADALKKRNSVIEQQLIETNEKIKAIMEIEQDLSIEQENLGAQ